jgi:alpha-N-arabinofuranosidase
VNQHRIKCYLDGQLREDYLVPPETERSLFVSVNRDTPKGELILKVVNASENVQPTAIHLQGVQHVADTGKAIVLTSASRNDENSFNDPHKVVPVTHDLTGLGRDFNYDFLPHSITLIRVKTH